MWDCMPVEVMYMCICELIYLFIEELIVSL